jgi:hypothetical protein
MPLQPIQLNDAITQNDAEFVCAQGGSCTVTARVRDDLTSSLYNVDMKVLDSAGMLSQLDAAQTSVTTLGNQLIQSIEQNENLFAFGLASAALNGQVFVNAVRWMTLLNDAISSLRSNIIEYRSSVGSLKSGSNSSFVGMVWMQPDATAQASKNISKAKSITAQMERTNKLSNSITAKWDQLRANMNEARLGRMKLSDRETLDVESIKTAYADLTTDQSALDRIVNNFATIINSAAANFNMTAPEVPDIEPLKASFSSILNAHNNAVIETVLLDKDTQLYTLATRSQINGYRTYIETYMRGVSQYDNLLKILDDMKVENAPQRYLVRMRQRATKPEEQADVVQLLDRAMIILKPEDEIYRSELKKLRDEAFVSMTGAIRTGQA